METWDSVKPPPIGPIHNFYPPLIKLNDIRRTRSPCWPTRPSDHDDDEDDDDDDDDDDPDNDDYPDDDDDNGDDDYHCDYHYDNHYDNTKWYQADSFILLTNSANSSMMATNPNLPNTDPRWDTILR